MAMLVVLAVCLLFLACLVGQPYYRAYRRRKIRSRAFPPAWREILRQRVPYFRKLPADLQLQLKQHIQVFMAEKKFIGCGGLDVTDTMRVTIAAQACLLILNRKTDYYPNLERILIYPGAFIVDKMESDAAGVLSEQCDVLAGESWSDGQIILSWEDTVDGAGIADDGRNVVIHEFAHQLDQENGPANGAPSLAHGEHYRSWSEVFSAEYSKLQEQAHSRQGSLLDHYGATDPAEFFAVASEVFFEQPEEMADLHPALYRQLSRFYRIDPLSWR